MLVYLYGRIVPRASWGLAGIQRIYNRGKEGAPTAGDDAGAATRNVPAMVYYGVDTDAAILMRMNSVPRSVAGIIGAAYAESLGNAGRDLHSAGGREVREWLSELGEDEWGRSGTCEITGSERKKVWHRLSGHAATAATAAAGVGVGRARL